jgi:hypothetical protein
MWMETKIEIRPSMKRGSVMVRKQTGSPKQAACFSDYFNPEMTAKVQEIQIGSLDIMNHDLMILLYR